MSETVDTKVSPDDERPARRDGSCYYCDQSIGADHETDCVIIKGRRFDAVPPYVWQPIETLPEGEHVALFFPDGEVGIGGIEMATVFIYEGRWSYWTHGGPNSGIDWEPRDGERPTMWMRLLHPKEPAVIDHEPAAKMALPA